MSLMYLHDIPITDNMGYKELYHSLSDNRKWYKKSVNKNIQPIASMKQNSQKMVGIEQKPFLMTAHIRLPIAGRQLVLVNAELVY